MKTWFVTAQGAKFETKDPQTQFDIAFRVLMIQLGDSDLKKRFEKMSGDESMDEVQKVIKAISGYTSDAPFECYDGNGVLVYSIFADR